ncbi:MAG: hypothetical protein GF401_19565 [Chitinivibrionales bacterium]|nr:hypothetical protein [Chitinivibrionales bacterium]
MKLRCLIIAALLALAGCSSSGPDSVAGGSGAGNPGGVVAFSMRIDSSQAVFADRDELPVHPLSPDNRSSLPIIIENDDGLKFITDQVYVLVDNIRFVLGNSDQALSIDMDNYAPLYFDDESFCLDGPFVCNVLSGTVEPSLEEIRVPDLRYKGVKISLKKDACTGECGLLKPSTIELRGTFRYEGEMHDFIISAATNITRFYKQESSSFSVDAGTVTRLLIDLDPRTWLEGVTIESCLASGRLQFDISGALVLDNKTGQENCSNIAADIHTNIVQSGKLKVAKDKRKN